MALARLVESVPTSSRSRAHARARTRPHRDSRRARRLTRAAADAGLVEALAKNAVIRSPAVRDAMAAVDRGHFVRAGTDAYYDAPAPIGFGATISAPHMHAHCLELLADKLTPTARVLDVGSGTGILLAYFAAACGQAAAAAAAPAAAAASAFRVVGVEHVDELVQWSQTNLEKEPASKALFETGAIAVVTGDGRLGLPKLAPFDVIHVGAAAPSRPDALIAQLAPGGRLIAPVGTDSQDLVAYDKGVDGSVKERVLMGVLYVPLTELSQQHQPRTFLA